MKRNIALIDKTFSKASNLHKGHKGSKGGMRGMTGLPRPQGFMILDTKTADDTYS